MSEGAFCDCQQASMMMATTRQIRQMVLTLLGILTIIICCWPGLKSHHQLGRYYDSISYDSSSYEPPVSQHVVNATSASSHLSSDLLLPQWLEEYIRWHAEMRAKFPDQKLLSKEEDGPKLLIRICPRTCGGLHDRMQHLGEYLYEAHQTKRILLLKWYNRFELESFLVPAASGLLNWTLPRTEETSSTPEALITAFPSNDSSDATRVVVKYLKDKVTTVPKNVTLPEYSTLWKLFFQPSARLQELLLSTTIIIPHKYSALHLRVRHPAHYNTIRDNHVDLQGLNWTKKTTRDFCLKTAIRAMTCITRHQMLLNNANATEEPLYVFSDSPDLVQYLVEASNKTYAGTNPVERLTHEAVAGLHLISRKSQDNAHLDLQNNGKVVSSWNAYAGTFVDLYIASRARCLAFGVGNFAVLAVKLSESGNKCAAAPLQYIPRTGAMAKVWGYKTVAQSQVCDLN